MQELCARQWAPMVTDLPIAKWTNHQIADKEKRKKRIIWGVTLWLSTDTSFSVTSFSFLSKGHYTFLCNYKNIIMADLDPIWFGPDAVYLLFWQFITLSLHVQAADNTRRNSKICFPSVQWPLQAFQEFNVGCILWENIK